MDYAGLVDNDTIDRLLSSLKKSSEFLSLDKTTGKRLYAILVECLENISKNSAKSQVISSKYLPFILAREDSGRINIKAGNPIYRDKRELITMKLDRINQLDNYALSALYDEVINKEIKQDDNGAGLGFILMKLKSGNKIDYSFTVVDNDFSFFEISILLNVFIMRKLIFEKTENSPKVILDPDNKIFEISGESRPPDVGSFYGEVLRWLDDYSLILLKSKDIADPFVFNFDLEYFNSSSAKYILDFASNLLFYAPKEG